MTGAQPRSRTRTRTVAVAGVAAVVALGVGGAVVFVPDESSDQAAAQGRDQGATAPIGQGDLTVSAEVDGTLGYGGGGSVYAQSRESGSPQGGTGGSGAGPGPSAPPSNGSSGSPSGSPSTSPSPKPEDKEREKEKEQTSGPQIFTGLPRVGDVVKQGDAMFHVNGRPVPLFYGDAPLWRALAKGVANGPDVKLLKHNLVVLGFGQGLNVDDKFTDGTEAAVKRWQKSLGLPQTGRVDPSAVAVQPAAVRVTAVKAVIGAPAQGEVATVSGTTRQVSVPLPVDKQALARKGDKVSVRLPDGRTTTGTVTDIGTVATPETEGGDGGGGGMPGGQGGGKSVVQVTVTLDKPEDAGVLDGAPVSVGFVSQSRKNVLSVPVNALVALAEGGYAVEVVDPSGARRLVAVQPGLFANGRVEITGTGLAAGQKVRVPS
ncbi:MAG: peptidoglycan-binding protein [Streptomycetaceae bacterium]|nr:peptidoglycan-binding protein [Streptomycetaceae bacterium]